MNTMGTWQFDMVHMQLVFKTFWWAMMNYCWPFNLPQQTLLS